MLDTGHKDHPVNAGLSESIYSLTEKGGGGKTR